MKTWKIFPVMAVAILFSGMTMCRGKAVAPLSGKYIVADTDAELKIVKITSSTRSNEVTFKAPFFKKQSQKEELTNVNADWQLFASWAWTDGEKWILVPQGDYSLKTELVGDNRIKGRLAFPKKGNGWYWVRIWGKEKKSGNWLWINQNSRYCRNDTSGNPGYEFLIHPTSNDCRVVPKDYQTRK